MLPRFGTQAEAQNFLYYLNRESSNDDCHIPVSTKIGEIKKVLEKCPDAIKYFEAFKAHKLKARHEPSEKECDTQALAKTLAFIQIFGEKLGRLSGARNFCAAASHYLKNKNFGYDRCVAKFAGKRNVNVDDIVEEFTKIDKSLCKNIDLAVERAIDLQDEMRQIEGPKNANSPRRAEWLREIGVLTKEGELAGERKFKRGATTGETKSRTPAFGTSSKEPVVEKKVLPTTLSTSELPKLADVMARFHKNRSFDNWMAVSQVDPTTAQILFDQIKFE